MTLVICQACDGEFETTRNELFCEWCRSFCKTETKSLRKMRSERIDNRKTNKIRRGEFAKRS